MKAATRERQRGGKETTSRDFVAVDSRLPLSTIFVDYLLAQKGRVFRERAAGDLKRDKIHHFAQ